MGKLYNVLLFFGLSFLSIKKGKAARVLNLCCISKQFSLMYHKYIIKRRTFFFELRTKMNGNGCLFKINYASQVIEKKLSKLFVSEKFPKIIIKCEAKLDLNYNKRGILITTKNGLLGLNLK